MLYALIQTFSVKRNSRLCVGVFLAIFLSLILFPAPAGAVIPGDSCKGSYSSDKKQIKLECDDSSNSLNNKTFKSSSVGNYTYATTIKDAFSGTNIKCTAALKVGNNPSSAALSGSVAPVASEKCLKVKSGSITIGVASSNEQKRANAASSAIISSSGKALTNLYCTKTAPAGTKQGSDCRSGNGKAFVEGEIKKCTDSAYKNMLPGQLIAAGGTDSIRNSIITCLTNANVGSKAAISGIVTKAKVKSAMDASSAAAVDKDADAEASEDEDTTTCAIDGVGWIVCPILDFMGKMNDAAFGFIADFLTIEPKLLTDQDTRVAWERFRDIANVAFVIAFLIIVYSQLTSAGISNYGIKRMLPRLFIAAVLVNISYILCQLAVDLSNILGSSLYSFIKDTPTTNANSVGFGDGLSFAKVTGYTLAVAGTLIIAIVLLLSVSTAALLAFALAILILIARKAILILLVVISPLAFVAYLLPNTEQWFKKWWKMFSTLLMVFPVVGVIFGASALAARIINNSGGEPDDSNIMLQITALGIMAIPLFAVPLVLKSALSAAGSIGGKLASLQDRANKGALSKAKSGRLGEASAAFQARRGKARVERRVSGRGIRGRANKILDSGRLGTLTGGDRGRSRAMAAYDAEYDKEVKESRTQLEGSMSHQQILDSASTGKHADGRSMTEHERDAAIQYAGERANFDERQTIALSSGTMTRTQRKSLTSGMRAKGDTSIYGNETLEAIERGDEQNETNQDAATLQAVLAKGTAERINSGKLSAEDVTKDYRVAKHVATAANMSPVTDSNGNVIFEVDPTKRGNLRTAINKYASENPQAWTRVDQKTKDNVIPI